MKLSNIFNIFRWRNRRGERVESTDANVFIEKYRASRFGLERKRVPARKLSRVPSCGRALCLPVRPAPYQRRRVRICSLAEVAENSNRGLAVRYLHLYEEIADRMHEVLRVLSIMIPTVLKGAIT